MANGTKDIKDIIKIPGYTQWIKKHVEEDAGTDASAIFEGAVKGWLKLLQLDDAQETAESLLRGFKESQNRKLPTVLRAAFRPKILPPKKVDSSHHDYPQRSYMIQLEPKELAFVALGFAVASAVAYQALQAYKSNKNAQTNTPVDAVKSTPAAPQTVEHTVIFAIEVSEEELVQWFRDQDYDAIKETGSLYALTKYLWYGKQDDLQSTGLSTFLNEPGAEHENDDYDVRLVKCTLRRDVPGFNGAASAMDRMDAFNQFFEEITACEVSERVSYEVYNTELYKTR